MVFVISSIDVHRFSFENVAHAGYWSLHEVNITATNETLFSDTKIIAPLRFSYHCSQEVVFQNVNSTLNFSNGFQVLYFIF